MLLAFSWAIILCSIGFQYIREKQYKSEFLSAQLQLYNINLLKSIEDEVPLKEYMAEHEPPFEELRVSIITPNGTVIYDNMIPIDSLDNHGQRPEVADAIKKGSGYHIARQSASDGREYFYSATHGNGLIVRTAIPYSATLHKLLEADRTFISVMISISLLMSILAYFATRRLGKNIERLNRFAEKAEKGESFDEGEMFPNDELGSISSHIVQLYAQWQQTIKDRDIAHEAAMREEQEKIRIKRQLTNNINHELKTPVASIQVCLETLLSGMKLSEEKRQELIERCYTHNERLRKLLGDVSLITRMEDGSQLIGKEPVVINNIINEIADELEIMPKEEQFSLHTYFNEQVVIDGNLSLIASILVPMLYIFLTFAIIIAITADTMLAKLGDLVKKLASWLLKILLYVFVGYVSVSGIISGTADQTAIKATKLTISGMFPKRRIRCRPQRESCRKWLAW